MLTANYNGETIYEGDVFESIFGEKYFAVESLNGGYLVFARGSVDGWKSTLGNLPDLRKVNGHFSGIAPKKVNTKEVTEIIVMLSQAVDNLNVDSVSSNEATDELLRTISVMTRTLRRSYE